MPGHPSSLLTAPVLSIIIPTHNRVSCLAETLEHLHAHLQEGIEVVVVDDGSTDRTSEVIPQSFPWLTFVRSNLRQGPSLARNQGLRAARGHNYLPLDSDCFIVPETLCWLMQVLKESQDQHLLFSCRPWPDRRGSVSSTPSRPYTTKDILLKTYGEVVPVLPRKSLQSRGLEYPHLFAGGEPLLIAELSQHVPLQFVNKVILEYRTDLPHRISSTEYQLQFSLEIGKVFCVLSAKAH